MPITKRHAVPAVAATCALALWSSFSEAREDARGVRDRRLTIHSNGLTNHEPHRLNGESSAPVVLGSSVHKSASPATILPSWDGLLSRRISDILPKDVPQLDGSTEATFIGRYHETESFEDKRRLLHLLAMGGGKKSFHLLTNVILREFGGRFVNASGDGLLRFAPLYVGLLARREDKALEFLLAGIRRELPLEGGLWKLEPVPISEQAERSNFWKGLALSGRPESRSLFHAVLAGECRAFTEGIESGVVTAAYYAYTVEHSGIDSAMSLFSDLDARLEDLGRWRSGTDNGKAWARWRADHDAAIVH